MTKSRTKTVNWMTLKNSISNAFVKNLTKKLTKKPSNFQKNKLRMVQTIGALERISKILSKKYKKSKTCNFDYILLKTYF